MPSYTLRAFITIFFIDIACAVLDTTPSTFTYSFTTSNSGVAPVSGASFDMFAYSDLQCTNDGGSRRMCGGDMTYRINIPFNQRHGEFSLELTNVELYKDGSSVLAFSLTGTSSCVFTSGSSMVINGQSSGPVTFTFSVSDATASPVCKFLIPRSTSNAVSAYSITMNLATTSPSSPFMEWLRTAQAVSVDDTSYDLHLTFTATLACFAALPDINEAVLVSSGGNSEIYGYWRGTLCGDCNSGWYPYRCASPVGMSLNGYNQGNIIYIKDTDLASTTFSIKDDTESFKQYIVGPSCSTHTGSPVIARSANPQTFIIDSSYPSLTTLEGTWQQICGMHNTWATNYAYTSLSFVIVRIGSINFVPPGTLYVAHCATSISLTVTDGSTVPYTMYVAPVGTACTSSVNPSTSGVITMSQSSGFWGYSGCSSGAHEAREVCFVPSTGVSASDSNIGNGYHIVTVALQLNGVSQFFWPHDVALPSSFTASMFPSGVDVSLFKFSAAAEIQCKGSSFPSNEVFSISGGTLTPPTTSVLYTSNLAARFLCISTYYDHATTDIQKSTSFVETAFYFYFVKPTGIGGKTSVLTDLGVDTTHDLEGTYVQASTTVALFTDAACTQGQLGAEMALTASGNFVVTAAHAATFIDGLFLCYKTTMYPTYRYTGITMNIGVRVINEPFVANFMFHLRFPAISEFSNIKYSLAPPTTPPCSGTLTAMTTSDFAISFTSYHPTWDLCFTHDNGVTVKLLQTYTQHIASFSISSALAPSSGRVFKGHDVTITMHGIVGTPGGGMKIRVASDAACTTKIQPTDSSLTGTTVVVSGSHLTTPTTAYVCFALAAQFFAMPLYVAGSTSLTPSAVAIEDTKSIQITSVPMSVAVGTPVTLEVTISASPVGSDVLSMTMAFEDATYSSYISAGTIIFTASSPLVQNLVITAYKPLTSKTFKMVVSGTAVEYVPPASTSLTILRSVSVLMPPRFRASNEVTVTLTLSEAPPTSVTITPSSAGITFTPTSVVFTPGSAQQTCVATAASPGTYSVSFSKSGTDETLVSPVPSVSVVVVPLATVYIDTNIRRIYNVPHGGVTIFVGLSELPIDTSSIGSSAGLIQVHLTAPSGLSLNTSVVSWSSSGPSLRQGINVTGLDVGVYQISVAITGTQLLQYNLAHSSFNVHVFQHKTFTATSNVDYVFVGAENTRQIDVHISALPDTSVVIVEPQFISKDIETEVVFSPSRLVWTNESITKTKTFNVSAFSQSTSVRAASFQLLAVGNASVEYTRSVLIHSIDVVPLGKISLSQPDGQVSVVNMVTNITVSIGRPPRNVSQNVVIGFRSNVTESDDAIEFAPNVVTFNTTAENMTCSQVLCTTTVGVRSRGYVGAVTVWAFVKPSSASSQYNSTTDPIPVNVLNTSVIPPVELAQPNLTKGTCSNATVSLNRLPIHDHLFVSLSSNVSEHVVVTPDSVNISKLEIGGVYDTTVVASFIVCARKALVGYSLSVQLRGASSAEYVLPDNTHATTSERVFVLVPSFKQKLYVSTIRDTYTLTIEASRRPYKGSVRVEAAVSCGLCVEINPKAVIFTSEQSDPTQKTISFKAVAAEGDARVTFSLVGSTSDEVYTAVNATGSAQDSTPWTLVLREATATQEATASIAVTATIPLLETTTMFEHQVRTMTLTKGDVQHDSRTSTESETDNPVKDFLMQVSDNVDQITERRQIELADAFTAINPTILKGKVSLSVVGAGSAIVRFTVLDLTKQMWQVVTPEIKAANLSPVGAISNVVPSPEANKITEAVSGGDVTTCASTVTVNANTPVFGTGQWSSNNSNVYITSVASPTTSVMQLPANSSVKFTWTITNLQLSSSSSMIVTRISVPQRQIQLLGEIEHCGIMSCVNMTLIDNAPLPIGFSGSWSVLSGSFANLRAENNTHALLSGSGRVVAQYTVSSTYCTSIATSNAVVDFPVTVRCNASTCLNGQCVDGSCICHRSNTLGHFAGIMCDKCDVGYSGDRCTERNCTEGTASCVNGKCSQNNTLCICHASDSFGHWSGDTCSECASNPDEGFWTGKKCNECRMGFSGPSCQSICVASIHCSGHGVCSSSSKRCECYQSTTLGFWAGEDCNVCEKSYYGDNCTSICFASSTCSGHGTCTSVSNGNVCSCFGDAVRGYWSSSSVTPQSTTTFCDACQQGHSGTTCLANDAPSCTSGTCVHGMCDANGNCLCHTDDVSGFWAGDKCDQCVSNNVDGYFVGLQCNECRRGYWGTTCNIECPNNKCSGHGSCSRDDGLCTCDHGIISGWWDASTGCQTCVSGFFGASCTVSCDPHVSCGGHGVCNPVDGSCVCFSNSTHGFWSSVGCTQCENMRTTESGCVDCLPDVFGATCSVRCTSLQTCNNHGTCSSSGICDCYNDTHRGFWSSDDCSSCHDGYMGNDCKTPVDHPLSDLCGGVSFVTDVSEIRFTDAFHQLLVRFTSATDMANTYRKKLNSLGVVTVDTSCTAYFTSHDVLSFGESPTCHWWSATELTVEVGYDFKVTVGEVLRIRPFTIIAVDANGSTECSSEVMFSPRQVKQPTTFRIPEAVLKVPSSVSFCTTIVLDGSASYVSSPRLSYIYSIEEAKVESKDNTDDVLLFLKATLAAVPKTSLSVSLPPTATPPGTYTFRLTVVDGFTGVTSTSIKTMTRNPPSRPGPKLEAITPKSVVQSSRSIVNLWVRGVFDPCVALPPDGALSYSWSAVPSTGIRWSGIDDSLPSLVIPPKHLDSGSKFTFTVSVTDPNGESTSETFDVQTTTSPLSAQLLDKQVKIGSQTTIRCNCYDPDVYDGAADTERTVVEWTCKDCPGALRTWLGSLTGVTNQVDVPRGIPDGPFFVTVNFSKGSRSATDTALMTFVSSDVLDVSISIPSVILSSQRTILEVVLPRGTTPEQFEYKWDSKDLDLSLEAVAPLGWNLSTLVLSENTMSPTREYNVSVTVTERKSNISGNVNATLSTRRPPSGGTLTVSYFIGDALSFNVLSASSWIADADALPLTYQFLLVDEEGGTVVLSDRTPSPVASVQLPQSEGGESVLVYRVVVTDSFGEITESDLPAVVSRANATTVALIDAKAMDDLQTFARSRDAGAALSTLTALTSANEMFGGEDDGLRFDYTLSSLGTTNTTNSTFVRQDHVSQVTFVVSKLVGSVASQSLVERSDSLISLLNGSLSALAQTMTPISAVDGSRLLQSASALSQSLRNHTLSNAGVRRSGTATKMSRVEDNIDLVDQLSLALMQSTVQSEERSVQSTDMTLACLKPTNQKTSLQLSKDMSSSLEEQRPGLQLCTAAWPTNIFGESSSNGLNVTSNVISITVRNDESQKVRAINVTFTIPIKQNRMKGVDSAANCAYFDFDKNTFSTRGCRIIEEGTATIKCNCQHLTDFAAVDTSANAVLPRVYLDIGNFSDIKVGGIIYVSVLAAIFAVMALIAYAIDQRRQRRLVDAYYRIIEFTTRRHVRRQSVVLEELAKAEGGIVHLPHSADFHSTTLRARIDSKNQPTDDRFDAPETREQYSILSCLKMTLQFHPWAAPFSSNSSSAFTIPQRVALLACLTMAALFFNGVFFADNTLSITDRVRQMVFAIACMILSAPIIVVVVSYFFERTPRTSWDARYSYLPENADVHVMECDSREPAEVLCERFIAPGHAPLEPVLLTEKELEGVAQNFLANKQGLLYISTLAAMKLEKMRANACSSKEVYEPIDHDSYDTDDADDASDRSGRSYSDHQPATTSSGWDEIDADYLYRSTCDVSPALMVPNDPYDECTAMRSRSNPLAEASAPPLKDDTSSSSSQLNSPTNTEQEFFCAVPATIGDTMQLKIEPSAELQMTSSSANRFAFRKRVCIVSNLIAKVMCSVTKRQRPNPSDPFFLSVDGAPSDIEGLMKSMWSHESRSVPWLLAVESVKMRELRLAECLFDLALMMECPDIYFVLYASHPPEDLSVALELIISSCQNQSTASVSRAWAQYYSAILLDLTPKEYTYHAVRCTTPSAVVLTSLLGLNMDKCFTRMGGVPYCIAEEVDGVDPNGLEEHIATLLKDSPIRAAHVLRLIDDENEDDMDSAGALHAATKGLLQPEENVVKQIENRIQSFMARHDAGKRKYSYRKRVAPSEKHRARYCPFVATLERSLPFFFPHRVLDRLLQEDECHTSFTRTLAAGRLHAMHLAKEMSGRCMNDFFRQYKTEQDEIIGLGFRLGVAPHPIRGWAGAFDGGSFEPKCEKISNDFAPPSKKHVGKQLANDYLLYLINFHVTGIASARFVSPAPIGLGAMMRYQPPKLQGTGSVCAPCFGWSALEISVCVGDTVFMYPGSYPPLSWSNVRCPPQAPILMCPLSGADPYYRDDLTFGKLDDEDKVTIEDLETEPALTSIIKLDSCSSIKFCGIIVRKNASSGNSVGLVAMNCDNITFQHCVFATSVLSASDASLRDAVSKQKNQHFGNSIHGAAWLRAQTWPPGFVVAGHFIAVIVFLMFALGALFVTASMTQSEANQWIERSTVSIILKVFVITPIVCLLKTSFTLLQTTTEMESGGSGLLLDFDA